jgi:glycerol-3-phosphate acyltransferase PlsY
MAPLAVGLCLLVWLALVWLTGYVSVGSVAAAALFPAAVWMLYPDRRPTIWIYLLLAAVIIWMHRANIARLRAGTENRFGRRAKATGAQ